MIDTFELLARLRDRLIFRQARRWRRLLQVRGVPYNFFKR